MTSSPEAGGIDAVVVSYRSASTLDACLRALCAAEAVASITVVDNASDDDGPARVRAALPGEPRLRLLANPDNRGFGVACNQGAAAGRAPWIALVNPDCLVEPDTLARLRRHAAGGTRIGLVGADLVDPAGMRDAAARRREPTLAAMLGRGGGLALAPDDRLALQPVDAASGALMLLPRPLYEALGGFDEGYRLHAEDLDLCRRVRDAGWRVVVANDVRVVHLRGVSSRSRPVFVEWHKHRGLWRYFWKFEGRRAGPATRCLAFAAIWAHFALRLPRLLWAQLRV